MITLKADIAIVLYNQKYKKLFKFLEQQNLKLHIIYSESSVNQNYRFDVCISKSGLQKDAMKNDEQTSGEGDTIQDAIDVLVSKIKGKTLIYNIFDMESRKIEVPNNLL